MRSRDLVKLGQLYLNDGIWSGHRVISSEWVKKSLSPHAEAREDTDYGYLWWLQAFHSKRSSFRSFGMYGSGGNKVLVFPKEALVVVITTTNYRVQNAAGLADKLILDYILEAVTTANAK